MRCTHCGFDNPADTKFCEQCGASQVRVCPNCGHAVSFGARFCGECGTGLEEQRHTEPSLSSKPVPQADLPAPIRYTPPYLAERILAEQAALQARGGKGGERKTITALFADMAGSTALIHNLDPEEARHLIDPVLELMREAVHHYEGYVAKSLGDGILALFGAPLAHEDHPRRALYAALRMQETMRHHSDRISLEQGMPLQIRIGIHTGEVVVRAIRTDDLHTDYDPVGNTIHIASRMEGIATPNSILVSEATFRLTEGYFEFKALGETLLKGVAEPVPVYELLGPGALRTRLQVAERRGLARFVGRQSELAQLQHALDQAKAGHGQIVGVVGEPGLGKSRLHYEFKRLLQQSDPLKACRVLETFSVAHGKAFAYLPLIELLKSYLHISPQDDEHRRRETITRKVLTLDRSLEDCLPYLFYLLGMAEQHSPLAQMDLKIRRQRIFEAISRLLIRESVEHPLVLIFEDLQWLDRETEAFLNVLSEGVSGARILLLVNYRPEYRHHWGIKSCYSQLRLEPLGLADAEQLLSALLGDDASLASLKPRIMAQTEGNPFFLEEVIQTLAEEQILSGEPGHYQLAQSPSDLHIPTTVQGVLSARIDRLAMAEKALLQALAVIGKDFSWSLLRQVAEQPEDALHRGLSRLQAGGFLYERPAFPEVEYSFKHALTQQVAYASLLLERRRLLHERTAQAIEALFPDSLEDHFSELAHHYSHSDNTVKAVTYLQRAGQQAARRSANQEAIGHLGAALALLPRLAESPERTQLELSLQLSLGPVWMSIRGFASPEVEAAYTRALTLCHEVGDSPQRFSVLVGLRRLYQLRAQYPMAQKLAEQLLCLAQDAQDPALLLEAHSALGMTLFFQGELGSAQSHLEQGIALYNPGQHRTQAFLYGLDSGLLCLSFSALALQLLGYPEQALKRSEQALSLIEDRPHFFSVASTLGFAAELHQFRREGRLTRKWAEAAITLSTQQGFAHWLAWDSILRGWALAEQGLREEGIAQIRQGLADYRATGATMWLSYFLALLAEALGAAGRVGEALSVLAETLAAIDDNQERMYEAELYRLKGELGLAQVGDSSAEADVQQEAEACFQRAIGVARRQGARSLELRAVLSLSRLWQRQGRKAKACKMLTQVYGTFTEGADTPDLQAARALLDQLI